MCGICGKVSFEDRPVEEALIQKMCACFTCRGPDGEGLYVDNATRNGDETMHVGIGHRRLAVIDLSPAGRQPMSNEDGTLWVICNGEIYNFKKLRKALIENGHTFKSNSDTEVILHLYEDEGIQGVNRLNGMFAFALWDQKNAELWICRDRIGIKPLVYNWDGRRLIFASEIKALLCDPAIAKEIDFQALQLYLAFSYIPAPLTIFKNICKLEPGHCLQVKNGRLFIQKYWDIPKQENTTVSRADFDERMETYGKRLKDTLSRAVKRRMVSDVPLGAFLSGGIDSSIIVALMAQHSADPIRTFSIGFEDDKLFDETRYAREVADRFRTDHHEFKLNYRDMLDVLPEVLSTFDEPFSDSSAIPTFIVSRETRKYVTVALSGDGGDELFAGYRSYLGEHWYKRYMSVPAVLRELLFEKPISKLPDSRDARLLEYIRRLKKFVRGTKGSFPERALALKEIFPEKLRREILLSHHRVDHGAPLKLIRRWLEDYDGDRLNAILYSDVKDSLPGDMLTRVDWMSMKNSLEIRVPFLDHHVVELAFAMCGRLKLHKGKTKYILKETFKDMLPESLYRRPKAGFEVPISRWLKTDLKFLLDRYLSQERIRKQDIFDSRVIDRLAKDHLNSRTDTSWMLWNLIVFQYWYDQYFK